MDYRPRVLAVLWATSRIGTRAGHQAERASVRECGRVSLQEGPYPRLRDFSSKAEGPISRNAHDRRKAMLPGFQRELWNARTKMNESSFNLAQIQRKGKGKRASKRTKKRVSLDLGCLVL
jgi:hypothetical protein